MRSCGAPLALLFLMTSCGCATHQSVASTGGVASDCGGGVAGPGFHAFACMSGGFLAGHPGPKELVVVGENGPTSAYPAFRVRGFAAGDGEVVAVYDDKLVRVASRRLAPVVTPRGVAKSPPPSSDFRQGLRRLEGG